MKIVVISFDFWNYDAHIVETLRKMGIDAHHINIGAYKHQNLAAKITNAFSKIFLKKNLKNIKRQELILEKLSEFGKQDQILVINPELIERKYHEKIKNYTNKYIAYLYDSLARCPAEHLLDLFDEVFSFDPKDAKTHGFQLITNYNYLPEQQYNPSPKYSLIYLASFDDRLKIAEKIAEKLEVFKLSYYFKIVGKKAWKKQIFGKKKPKIIYTRKRTNHQDIPNIYAEGKVILDLVREKQDGLSFRILEAMALKKKIITSNPTVVDYDFYLPENILVMKPDLSNLEKSFFEADYQELNPEIYYKYTIDHWVKTVFKLS